MQVAWQPVQLYRSALARRGNWQFLVVMKKLSQRKRPGSQFTTPLRTFKSHRGERRTQRKHAAHDEPLTVHTHTQIK